MGKKVVTSVKKGKPKNALGKKSRSNKKTQRIIKRNSNGIRMVEIPGDGDIKELSSPKTPKKRGHVYNDMAEQAVIEFSVKKGEKTLVFNKATPEQKKKSSRGKGKQIW